MKKFNKALAVFLAILCILSSVCVIASAAAPGAKISEITDSTVTISPVNNCQYGWKVEGSEGEPLNYQDSNVLSGFNGGTSNSGYVIYVKNKTTNEYSTISIAAAPAKPSDPVFESCTSTSITLENNSSLLYRCVSFDGTKVFAWQESNKFENLNKDTLYTVYTKVKTGENQLQSAESDGLIIRTAHRDAYRDSKFADCRVELSNDEVNIGTNVKFTAVGAFKDYDNDQVFVSGDVRYIPVSWKAIQVNTGTIISSGSWKDGKIKQSATVKTDTIEAEAGSKDVKVNVYVDFQMQEFVRTDISGTAGRWINKGATISNFNDFPVKPEPSIWEKVQLILSSIISVLTGGFLWLYNTFMAFITPQQ